MIPISINDAYRNRSILLLGASGFVGKVWLSMLLSRVPTIEKIYVLLRRKGGIPVLERFERMINASPAFLPLHLEFKHGLSTLLRERVEVVEGDVTRPGLGIDPDVAERLCEKVDLVVNCSGLVDFFPDLREARAVNIEGALEALSFTQKCKDAALLHVSTCYVAGIREGHIPEAVLPERSPNNQPFDPEAELQALEPLIQNVIEQNSAEEIEQAIRERFQQKEARGGPKSETRIRHMVDLFHKRKMREQMIEAGKKQAARYGWQNSYTYSKALAEKLIMKRSRETPHTIFRPSIIESAAEFPFPGWNEGFNTSGPLAYLLGTWFRYLPAKVGNPFDVIPVDHTCIGLTLAGAALLSRCHKPVYQCATSDRNLFTIDRACELTSLAHRIFYRSNGDQPFKRMVLSRWDALPVNADSPLTVKGVRKTIRNVTRFMQRIPSNGFVPLRAYINKLQSTGEIAERKLDQVEKVLALFTPFTHDYHQIFVTEALFELDPKEEVFRFRVDAIDWRRYWLDVQMPGLRRWCFPSIEGKETEEYRTNTPVHLVEPARSAYTQKSAS